MQPNKILVTVKASFTKTVANADSVDQDRAVQNVKPDLRFTLSAFLSRTFVKTFDF